MGEKKEKKNSCSSIITECEQQHLYEIECSTSFAIATFIFVYVQIKAYDIGWMTGSETGGI